MLGQHGSSQLVTQRLTSAGSALQAGSWRRSGPSAMLELVDDHSITMGYHRLWSHRAFQARTPLRILLAGMGCLGFQGSIKWWVLRHRLHHRFTDSDDDPCVC